MGARLSVERQRQFNTYLRGGILSLGWHPRETAPLSTRELAAHFQDGKLFLRLLVEKVKILVGPERHEEITRVVERGLGDLLAPILEREGAGPARRPSCLSHTMYFMRDPPLWRWLGRLP